MIYQYGIDINHFRAIKKEQESSCKICNTYIEDEDKLYVDHCHSTGKVRGLLCNNCNFGIGQFKDDTELLEKAIEYLKEAQNGQVDNMVQP